MKIQVEVEIFDDPEYCEHETGYRSLDCCYLRRDVSRCRLFREFLAGHGKDEVYEKCPQCKEAWQKAQDREFMYGNRENWSEEKQIKEVKQKINYLLTPQG
jgi:hypothetical protein